MCGITASYNVKNAKQKVSKILVEQSSRGKDASGIAFINNGTLNLFKKALPPEELDKLIQEDNNVTICIGHNRAATSNMPEKDKDKEAHPFISENRDFCLVHNGSVLYDHIYRYILSTFLGHKFSSGVDSEIFIHLLEELLKKNKSRYKAIKEFFKVCKGNVLVLFKDGELFGFPYTSSFVVSLVNNQVYIASESLPLIKNLPKVNLLSVKCFVPKSSSNNQMLRVILDKKGITNLDLYGDWSEEILKEGSWIAVRNIMCDVCKTVKMCEKVIFNKEQIDRCLDCHNKGKFPKDITTTTGGYYTPGVRRRERRNKRVKSEEEEELEKETKTKCISCENWLSFSDAFFCSLCEKWFCKKCYYNGNKHVCRLPHNRDGLTTFFNNKRKGTVAYIN